MENYPENGNQFNENTDMGNINTTTSSTDLGAEAFNSEKAPENTAASEAQKLGTCPPGFIRREPYNEQHNGQYNGQYNQPPVNRENPYYAPQNRQYPPSFNAYGQYNSGNTNSDNINNNAGTSPYTARQQSGNFPPNVPPYTHNQNQNYGESPSSIYNNCQNSSAPYGGAPQYHYGRPVNFMDSQYYAERQAQNLRRREQQNDIKKLALIIALTMGGFLCMSFLFSLILKAFNLFDLYYANSTFSSAFGILYSVLTVGLPFFVAKKLLKNKKNPVTIPYNAPKDAKKTVLLLLIGFGGCMAANFIVSIITSFFDGVGVHFAYSEGASPQNLTDVIMLFIGTAVFPPLIEEFAMRGVVMQSLRKYGNSFAILATAFCFGIFHGNPTQIPFAFICGLFLAYVVIASGSIWTGVVLHFLVNATACVQETVTLYGSENAANVFWIGILVVGVIAGIVALVIYYQTYRIEKLIPDNSPSDLTLGEKFKKFIFNPAMIIVIIVFVFEALSFVSLSSPSY